jgi:hypothetical protein
MVYKRELAEIPPAGVSQTETIEYPPGGVFDPHSTRPLGRSQNPPSAVEIPSPACNDYKTDVIPGLQMAKAGAGTLVLSGNNVAATGGLALAAGVTRFASATAINGTARTVAIGSSGTLMFGPGFGAANLPAALLNRVTRPQRVRPGPFVWAFCLAMSGPG